MYVDVDKNLRRVDTEAVKSGRTDRGRARRVGTDVRPDPRGDRTRRATQSLDSFGRSQVPWTPPKNPGADFPAVGRPSRQTRVDPGPLPAPAPPPTARAVAEPAEDSWVAQLFDTSWASQVYHWLTDHEMWAEQNASLLAHLGPNAPADPEILDLGAGTGIGTRALARALNGRGLVTGLEYAQPMVDLAVRNGAQDPLDNVRFMQGDATAMDLPDRSVDYVVANSFLYLVPDAAGVLAEAKRVLRPGGRLVFMEPREEGNLAAAAGQALGHAGELLRRPSSATRLTAAMLAWRVMSGFEGRRTEAELTQLLKGAGFESIRFEPTLGGLGHHVIAS